MEEYRIVRMKGFHEIYKIQEKTGFWIFKWWVRYINNLTLEEANGIIKTLKENAEWRKYNPPAKEDTVIETFKF